MISDNLATEVKDKYLKVGIVGCGRVRYGGTLTK